MKKVVASTVITFGEGVSELTDLMLLEFDPVLNVDAEGKEKSQWAPGETIYFLVQHAAKLRLAWVKATSGQIVAQGTASRKRVERMLWTELTEVKELAAIPAGGLTPTWYGNSLAGLKKKNSREVVVSSGKLPAVCDLTYSGTFKLYKLLTPKVTLGEDEAWPLTIEAHFELGSII